MKKIIILSILVLLTNCKGDKSNTSSSTTEDNKLHRTLPSSTGRFNELLVVTSQDSWIGSLGSEVKKVVAQDVIALPLPEPLFSIVQVNPNQFSNLLQKTRNILTVKYGDYNKVDIQKNVFATPQIVVDITAQNDEELSKLMLEYGNKIVKTYKQSDLDDLRKNPIYKPHNFSNYTFAKTQKISLKIPSKFELVDDKKDFIWFRDETYDPGKNIRGSKNIIAYTLPLDIDFKQVKDSIAKIRDVIGEKYVPGPNEGTYLITEPAYTPHIFEVTYNDMPAYKTHGLFAIFNRRMGGPFVSYTIEDKPNKRLIIVEGFVYAPLVQKRDFMFELEAVIGTLKIE